MMVLCPHCGNRLEIRGDVREEALLTCSGCRSAWKARRKRPSDRTAWIADAPRPFRNFLEQELVRLGFTVRIFEDGGRVVRELEQSAPILLIINVILPGLLGVEVCERVKQETNPRSVPVILVGAIHNVERYHRRPRYLYGADEYIEEGISPNVLAGIVARLTGVHPEKVQARSPEQERQSRAARLFLARFVAEKDDLFKAYLTTLDKGVLRRLYAEGETRLTAEGSGIPPGMFRDFLLQYLKSKIKGDYHG
jgi:DNA-binding response OmpR family regulator